MRERQHKNENFNLTYFLKTSGQYNIPELFPVHIQECPELINFNQAVCASSSKGRGVHFFIDDYHFIRDFIKSKGFKWSGAEKKWVK